MPQTCSICSHAEREAIEKALVAGTPLRRVASQFGTSDATLRRHKSNCMKPAIQAAEATHKEQTKELQEQSAWNALTEMQWLHQEVHAIYEETRKAKDHRFSLQALGEVRQQTKLFGELLQGMEPGQAEKLEQEWLNMREIIFAALEPYPEARLAVARALLALGKSDDQSREQLG